MEVDTKLLINKEWQVTFGSKYILHGSIYEGNPQNVFLLLQ